MGEAHTFQAHLSTYKNIYVLYPVKMPTCPVQPLDTSSSLPSVTLLTRSCCQKGPKCMPGAGVPVLSFIFSVIKKCVWVGSRLGLRWPWGVKLGAIARLDPMRNITTIGRPWVQRGPLKANGQFG